MSPFRRRFASSLRPLIAGGALTMAMASCGREPSAPAVSGTPGVVRSQGIAFLTQFPAALPLFQAAGGAVEFTKVRILLNNPDGSVALDTVVTFPAGATELQLTLTVPLPASAPASGVPLGLNLDYQNASGVTVFHGGPVTVTAVPTRAGSGPPPPSQVTIPISYTGPGANATRVAISPKTLTVNTGQSFTFTAQAFDAAGNVLPNTPVVFTTNSASFATVNAATGAGLAGPSRGSATITAQLLTGPTDAATLTIQSPPAGIAAVSGGGQTAPVGTTLPQPVVVRVTAADGLGAPGVPVSFAAGNGGSVGAATVTTDANGNAQTTWKLGNTVGTQTLTASATGLSGSPVTFTATGRSIDPVRLAFLTQPVGPVAAGTALSPAIVVQALDAAGGVATAFTGPVSVALGAGSPATARLLGTTTVNAVAGVATFGDLSLTLPGSYSLATTSPNLASATSASFVVTPGAATKLVFQNYPIIGATAGSVIDPVTVEARDAFGNTATAFTGPVTISINAAAAAIRAPIRSGGLRGSASTRVSAGVVANLAVSGTPTVNAIAGIATFPGLSFSLVGGFALTATSGSLAAAIGPTFTVTPGPPGILEATGGNAQQGSSSAPLPSPIVVRVSDRFGNPISGVTVSFSPASGGTANPTSAVTDASGLAHTSWTLGAVSGAQVLHVNAAGLPTLDVTATAGGSAASAGDFIVIHDVNWGDNSYGIPYAGNVQFMKNLVNFSIGGARASANKVMLLDFLTLSYYNFSGNWSGMASVFGSQGYTAYNTSDRTKLVTVPADVKVVILHLPSISNPITIPEINGIKAFLAQGGRVLYIGENSGFQYTLSEATSLLSAMGASTTATGSCAWGTVTVYPHQLTTGIANNTFNIACASIINPGAGDYVLMRDASGNAIAVVAHVNTTPIPPASIVAPPARLMTSGSPVAGAAPAGQVATPSPDPTLGAPGAKRP